MAHTTGPWVIDPSAPYGEDLLGLRSANGKVVAAVSLITNGEGPANARLIAAAPDLLEAAKYALQWVMEVDPDVHPSLPTMLRAAISKAQGE